MIELATKSRIFAKYVGRKAFPTDTVGVQTYRHDSGIDLQTGVRGCQLRTGDVIDVKSPVPLEDIGLKHASKIRIFGPACLGCLVFEGCRVLNRKRLPNSSS